MLELRHVFFRATSSENDQGSMNLASNTASVATTRPSRVAAIHRRAGWRILPLNIRNDLAGVGFIPAPIEVFGYDAELDDEITGQVLRFDLAALFAPEPQQCRLIITHDNPSIRPSDKVTATDSTGKLSFYCHVQLLVLE